MLLHAQDRLLPETYPKLLLLIDVVQDRSYSGRVSHGKQDARLTIYYDFGIAPRGGSDHWQPRGHGFQKGIADAFGDRGQHINIQSVEEIGDLLHLAQEPDAIFQIRPVRYELMQIWILLPLACNNKAPVRPASRELRARPKKGHDVFDRFQPADRSDRSEEHTSELQSHSFISYAAF